MNGDDLFAVAVAGLAGIFGLLAIVGCCVTLATLLAVRRYGRRAGAPPLAVYPSLTVLKPLYGAEPGLAENLADVCRQAYPGPFEIVFGVQREGDPALAVARDVAAAHPDVATTIVVDATRHGENGKVSNLINMGRSIRHEVVLLADSDMMMEPGDCRSVVEALAVPGVGLVTCLYRGAPLPNLWARLTAAGIDGHFLPNVLFGLTLRLAKPCFGSTIALRADTLAAIGGFAAFKDILADDNALGQAVRALGRTVAVPARPVLAHRCTAETAVAMLRQDLRWSRTIKAVDPAGFAGSIVTNPLPLALIAWLFQGMTLGTTAIVVATLACRYALQLSVSHFAGAPKPPFWLGPIRDLVSFAVFVASFWPGSLDWRGQAFAVDAKGTMAPPGQTGS